MSTVMYDGMSDLMAVFCLFAGMSFDMPLGTLRFTGVFYKSIVFAEAKF
jgi:hypothetical protein